MLLRLEMAYLCITLSTWPWQDQTSSPQSTVTSSKLCLTKQSVRHKITACYQNLDFSDVAISCQTQYVCQSKFGGNLCK